MEDVLLEKIREYRNMLKLDKPDLDLALLLKILDITNESSEVRVAIEPVADSGEWLSDTPSYAVKGVKELDDGRIVLYVSDEKHGMHAGDLFLQLKKILKHASGSNMPVLFLHGGEVTQLTEAYSHSLVEEQWAGLPFDVILAVRKRAVVAVEEDEEQE